MADSPGGAAAMRATAPFGFRYQYLAGGANTGGGWATWNTNGDFPSSTSRIQSRTGSCRSSLYYMLAAVVAAGGGGESDGISQPEQHSDDDGVLQRPEAVLPEGRGVSFAEGGPPCGAGLLGLHGAARDGDDARRYGEGVRDGALRARGAPEQRLGICTRGDQTARYLRANVFLGYHISVWGTGTDIALSNPSDATVDQLAGRAATFYKSLAANFDVAFAEFSDRDSGFYQFVYGDGGHSWWDAEDFRRNVRFLSGFSASTGKRIVMWQIPLGNTKMRVGEQHERSLSGQSVRVAARRSRPRASGGLPRRRCRCVPVRWRCGRHDVRLRCDRRRRDQPRGDQRQHAGVGGRPAGSAPVQLTRGSTPTLVTPYAANDDGGFFRWKSWQYRPGWRDDVLRDRAAGSANQPAHSAVTRPRFESARRLASRFTFTRTSNAAVARLHEFPRARAAAMEDPDRLR